MSIKPVELKKFVSLAQNTDLGYNDMPKGEFHRLGKKVLKTVANMLRLPAGTFDIRSNKGGIAVSGEVTLHGEGIYIQFSQIGTGGNSMGFMYRSCKGRKDYSGGANNWMKWEVLLDLETACQRFERVIPAEVMG